MDKFVCPESCIHALAECFFNFTCCIKLKPLTGKGKNKRKEDRERDYDVPDYKG